MTAAVSELEDGEEEEEEDEEDAATVPAEQKQDLVVVSFKAGRWRQHISRLLERDVSKFNLLMVQPDSVNHEFESS